ncbi:hypothetical protein CTheo_5649 [Ceratobasidium theobromae]|uniref:Uncharacterized protein n=1 Tax=Ceratobasidium theobromae TaxID=1582974 RepID=A0A5N5QHW9_9AGAM|nr:hypothetical protein CTheo_5649 [Ceratobasidium theobromae]
MPAVALSTLLGAVTFIVTPSEELASILIDRLRESRRHREHGEEEEKEIRDEGRSTHVELEKCSSVRNK